ncbi:MAG TPA: SMC family ATPase [Myxococcota bacterium]|mgnify:CR=1 FL=1|nr:SMC family ATPase [Myxococcota bacterium]HQK51240.1 SMC family ATPase [Myxococcota bacterium]
MIPIRLTVQAFGPYVQRQVVDFGPARDAGVFLVHGPTGAGKTTLFDAICYALYGQSSGAERTDQQMRSQLAPSTLRTEVELEFALGEWHYRCWRSPTWDRPALRGQGTTKAKAEAHLHRRPAGGTGEWSLLQTGDGKVTEAIQAVLGFTAEEFRQVILIPQGQFRSLLVAEVKDREHILGNLFNTALYRRIEEELKAETARRQTEFRTLEERHQTLLGTGDVASLEDLEQRIRQRQVELETMQAGVKQRRDSLQSARAAAEEGRRVRGIFEEARRARRRLEDLEQRREEIGSQKALLERARRALTLNDLADGLHRLRQQAEQRREDLSRANRDLEEARLALDLARDGLERQRANVPETEAMERALVELKEMGPRLQALEQAEGEVQAAEERLTAAEERLRAAREGLEALEQEMRGLDRTIEALDPLAEDKARRGSIRDQQVQQRNLRRRLGELQDQHRTLEKRLQRQADQERMASAGLEQARRTLEEALEVQRREMAAVLAARLVPGDPCPVCGSTSHPAPAPIRENLPDGALLDRLRQEADAAAETWKVASDEMLRIQEQWKALGQRIEEMVQDLGEAAGASLEELEARCQEAEQQVREAEEAARRLAEARTRRREAETRLEQGREVLEAIQGQVQEARSARDRAAALRQERQAGLPPGRDRGTWEQQVAESRAALAARKQALEKAEQSFREASARWTGAEARQTAAATESDRTASELEEMDRRFQERLREQGFMTPEEWSAARLAPDGLAALEEQIQGWVRDVVQAQGDVDRLEAGVAGLQEPDVAALEAAEAEALAGLEAAQAAAAQAVADQERDQDLATRLRQVQSEQKAIEERLRGMERLSGVARGENPVKLSFHDFVLGLLLDQVLEAANLRLKVMSRGRFQLFRRRVPADRRKREGLSLDVEDGYSGSLRAVHTLSGGESFQAALALSLGLADVVQQRAGGIRLETLFLDEGFGNLDAEAREEAWNHLAEMSGREGGRLVGIISHMEDLKALCPRRLEVRSGPAGATVRWSHAPVP